MKPQVKYGLLTALATFVIFVVMASAGSERNWLLSYADKFVMAFGLYFAIKDTREVTGFITYSRSLGIGVLTSLVTGSADGAGRYFYCKFINHNFVVASRNLYLDLIESMNFFKGHPDELDSIKRMVPVIVSPGSIFVSTIVGALFTGLILSLIIAAVLKKDKPDNGMPSYF